MTIRLVRWRRRTTAKSTIGYTHGFKVILFHNSSYMQKTQIMKSKNNVTYKLWNIVQQGKLLTTYADPLKIIKNK